MSAFDDETSKAIEDLLLEAQEEVMRRRYIPWEEFVAEFREEVRSRVTMPDVWVLDPYVAQPRMFGWTPPEPEEPAEDVPDAPTPDCPRCGRTAAEEHVVARGGYGGVDYACRCWWCEHEWEL
jgi:hypothetical protein